MTNVFETIVGFIVLILSVWFCYFAYHMGSNKNDGKPKYFLTANFDNADGIHIGSDVRVSGVSVGRVIEHSLDHESYFAVVKIAIDDKVHLPEDSSAQIVSSGLLGEKYIAILPGAETKLLQNGDLLEFTQSSVNIEGLISKFLFGLNKDSGNYNDEHGGEEKINNKEEMKSDSQLHKSKEEKSTEQGFILNDSNSYNSIS